MGVSWLISRSASGCSKKRVQSVENDALDTVEMELFEEEDDSEYVNDGVGLGGKDWSSQSLD